MMLRAAAVGGLSAGMPKHSRVGGAHQVHLLVARQCTRPTAPVLRRSGRVGKPTCPHAGVSESGASEQQQQQQQQEMQQQAAQPPNGGGNAGRPRSLGGDDGGAGKQPGDRADQGWRQFLDLTALASPGLVVAGWMVCCIWLLLLQPWSLKQDALGKELQDLKADALGKDMQDLQAELKDWKAERKADVRQIGADMKDWKAEWKADVRQIGADMKDGKAEWKADIRQIRADMKNWKAEWKADFRQINADMKQLLMAVGRLEGRLMSCSS